MVVFVDGEPRAVAGSGEEAVGRRRPQDVLVQAQLLEPFQGGPGDRGDLPGVVGDWESVETDSFYEGLLGPPQYTRPEVWQGRPVPAVLLGGNHAAIRRWRLMQALGRTWRARPDLLASRALTPDERALLEEYCKAAGVEPPQPVG